MAVYYIKDVTITGTEDSPQTISYGSLTDITGSVVPSSFDTAPLVMVIPSYSGTSVLLTDDPATSEFYVAMSDLRDDITATSIICNIIITEVISTTSWTTKIATTQITTNTTENTDDNIYMFRGNYLFLYPIPSDVWELELIYRYNPTVTSIDDTVDLPQEFGDFLENRILSEYLVMSAANDDGSVRTGSISQAKIYDNKYKSGKTRAKEQIHSNINVGISLIKPCKW